VILSKDETYGDTRLMSNGITALVSITVVAIICVLFAWCLYPWTGDSREPQSIMKEIRIYGTRFKEITLWDKTLTVTLVWRWFKRFWPLQKCKATAVDFDQLLTAVGFPKCVFAFRHQPQDMHESVLHVIAKHPNICKHIHLPVQSEVIEF
jgi:tRNA-2-methylthio-N6-dimethylallyladenosine synthase